MSTTSPTHLEQLGLDPDGFAEQLAGQLSKLTRRETGSELVYTPDGEHSYYRDLLATEGYGTSSGAQDRIDRHRVQMETIAQDRAERAQRRLEAMGLEIRVEPDRTQGFGGYFAPPLWLNKLFATANRPHRVLADLIPRFPLPPGVQSINLPIISSGSAVAPDADDSDVGDQDLTDSAGSSPAVPLSGDADIALQLLELSPVAAAADWAIFLDLSEAYDADLESQLLTGPGGSQLLGVANVPGIVAVPYTSVSPTGGGLYPFLGQVMAQIGDGRNLPPECWLMRTARWAWLQTSEGTDTLPFAIASPFFLGKSDDTPDPVGGLIGLPVFLDDALPKNVSATVTAGVVSYAAAGSQDLIIGLRPSDLVLLESEPQTAVYREPLSASLGVRLQMHGYAAAITGRRPAGIGVLVGTGLAVQSGF